MREYHWMCVFMICANKKKREEEERKRKRKKKKKKEIKEREKNKKTENIRVLAISPKRAPLSSSPK